MQSALMNDHNVEDVGPQTSIFRRIGTYLPVMIILGLAVPAAIYLGIMQMLGWRSPMVGVNAVLSYVAPSSNKVILYGSANTKAYFSNIGGNYEVLLVPWRQYFSNRNMNFKEIQDATQLKKLSEGVLILPSALALNEEERAEITSFRAKGGAILTTWATGTRSGTGAWAGWQFLEDLGTKMVGEIPAEQEVNHLVLHGESPLSNTLPSGQRIGMDKTAEKLLRFKGDMVAGRFMNWARTVDEDRRGEGAVIYSERTGATGRVASFAFAESAWESHPLATYSLIDDTILWLQRTPVIVRGAWPNGKRSAQVIEMDTEQGFPNALLFASMMQSLEIPTTFYVLTSVGKLFPDILTKLAREFEVAYHGDVHVGFKGQSAPTQEQRLQTMRAEMASVIPDTQKITGFRAPTEGYDAITEQLMQKLGIRHHVADPSRTEGRLPFVAKMEDIEPAEALIVLPRTQRDDINLHWEKLNVEQMTKALIDDADIARETAALGLLSVHSQNFSADSVLIKAMPGYLVHLKQLRDSLWLASAGQVVSWWRDRERIKLSSEFFGKRLEFNITVKGDKPVTGVTLIVMLPQKGVLPSIQSIKIGLPMPTVTRIDDFRAAVIFSALNPGNYVYQVTF
jgi:Polysaccharide deacetylase